MAGGKNIGLIRRGKKQRDSQIVPDSSEEILGWTDCSCNGLYGSVVYCVAFMGLAPSTAVLGYLLLLCWWQA